MDFAILAQIPGADQAIQSAASQGWEAVLLVVLVLAITAFFAYMMRKIMQDSAERESRLAARVTHLEDLINTELFSVLKANSDMIGRVSAAVQDVLETRRGLMHTLEKLSDALDMRPCMLPKEEQEEIMRRALKKRRDSGEIDLGGKK